MSFESPQEKAIAYNIAYKLLTQQFGTIYFTLLSMFGTKHKKVFLRYFPIFIVMNTSARAFS